MELVIMWLVLLLINPYDTIEISIGSLVGILNTVDVYYPVLRDYCAGTPAGK